LETGHFQGTQKRLVHCQSRIRPVDHWHDDNTREAFGAEAEGEATSFKRPCGVRLNGADHQWGKDPPKEVVG